MREKEEGKASSFRRALDEDHLRQDDDPPVTLAQPLETLRPGYSWVRALEARYPGWKLYPVDGFPFTLPIKKVAESRLSLVSLAGVYRNGQKPFSTSPGMVPAPLRAMRFRDRGDWSMREIASAIDMADLVLAHAHYDHAEADEDVNCVFPLARLLELEMEGFIGECAPTHYSLMGYVPEATPLLQTVRKELLPRLHNQRIDAVLVSGGCELSHQSAALVQREIEAAGIPTVGVSACRDISYALQVPRAVALRFPVGNPFGSSMDAPMQSRVLRDALGLIDSVTTPGEIVDLPYEWVKI